MVGVLVTFNLGNSFNEAAVRKIAAESSPKFEGMSQLRSKTFTVDRGRRQAMNFYVWETAEAARAFFTDDLLDRATALYGVTPGVQFVEIAALVNNPPA